LSRVALVVDDDPAVLDLLAEMLKDLGWEVITALNGTDALTALANDRRIDILISDVNMPGVVGYELAEKAKRVRKDLKVILLSGRESDSHCLPMIRKPFLQDELERVMRRTTGLC
jgi:two-component system cell cycle response regulator CpdR